MADDLKKLVDLMATLRGPDGCPWDRKQTAESLKPFLIEESYEVIDALDEKDPGKIKEELGDLLFQIIFHARLAEEQGQFSIRDVIADERRKDGQAPSPCVRRRKGFDGPGSAWPTGKR